MTAFTSLELTIGVVTSSGCSVGVVTKARCSKGTLLPVQFVGGSSVIYTAATEGSESRVRSPSARERYKRNLVK